MIMRQKSRHDVRPLIDFSLLTRIRDVGMWRRWHVVMLLLVFLHDCDAYATRRRIKMDRLINLAFSLEFQRIHKDVRLSKEFN